MMWGASLPAGTFSDNPHAVGQEGRAGKGKTESIPEEGKNRMKPICTIINQTISEQTNAGQTNTGQLKLVQKATVYVAAAAEPIAYCHATTSGIVAMSSNPCFCPTSQIIDEKPALLGRLATYGINEFTIGEFLSLAEPELAAVGVTGRDLSFTIARLFLFASGGLPIANTSPNQNQIFMGLKTTTTICRKFGDLITEAFTSLSNQAFMDRLVVAMTVLRNWEECDASACGKPEHPFPDHRNDVPRLGNHSQTVIREKMGLRLKLTQARDRLVFTGVEGLAYRKSIFCRSLPPIEPGGITASATDVRNMGILAGLACPC